MAIPDQVQVPSGTHTQRFLPASFTANSISVLNPNDGICFVARDRDCLSQTIGAWDWKVPSQSYAYLPGPFRSVGLLYLDRSGASLPGDISTYASEQKLELPVFHAIGRAQVSNVTTLDIGQGNQPQPPAISNVRLWADGNGDLHILGSNNVDNLVYDSSNIGTAPMLGHVTGTIGNNAITLPNGQYAGARRTDAVLRNAIGMGTDNRLKIWSAPYVDFVNQAGTANIVIIDDAGNVNTAGQVAANGLLSVANAAVNGFLTVGPAAVALPGDIGATRTSAPSTGIIYLGNTGGRYLYYNGTDYLMPNGNLRQGGYVYSTDGSNGVFAASNGNVYLRSPGGVVVIDGAFGGGGDLQIARDENIGRNLVITGTMRAGSNTGFMGQVLVGVNFSSTTVNAWLATPLTLSFTVNPQSAGSVFAACNAIITSAVQGTMFYCCLALDGAISDYRINWIPVANQYMTISITDCFTALNPGVHTLTLYVNANAGVFSLWTGAHNSISVFGLMS